MDVHQAFNKWATPSKLKPPHPKGTVAWFDHWAPAIKDAFLTGWRLRGETDITLIKEQDLRDGNEERTN